MRIFGPSPVLASVLSTVESQIVNQDDVDHQLIIN
jgi:hypothetical protein